jgi:nucleotide sugar dehydrogenase
MMTHPMTRHSPRPHLSLTPPEPAAFVREIAVVGPGVVGMPIAALLANAELWATDGAPTRVVVVQRPSPTSAWKVGAINAGRSPIGGPEQTLDTLVAEGAGSGRLRATTSYLDIREAELILVCVQTDRRGMAPDYTLLLEALHGVAEALRQRTSSEPPVVVIESTLAPSSMLTTVRDLFAGHGLVEGRDLLLANSPNRVTPGRMVERVGSSDKLIGALRPETTARVARVYGRIVRGGTLHRTNSLTAEVVKTLGSAYRDVRIAYAAEVVRYCDARDIDFFAVRRQVNERLAREDDGAAAIGTGMLVPRIGVGGHCLPMDGIHLWWRAQQHGTNPARSLMLEARRINDEAPGEIISLIERFSGPVAHRSLALLGVAYRFDSEDARNSPTLTLARMLGARGAAVSLHDPHVGAADLNLLRSGLAGHFHRAMADALATADLVVVCVPHREYLGGGERWLPHAQRLRTVIDCCNLYRASHMATTAVRYGGLGRGIGKPSGALVGAVTLGLRAVSRGFANEARMLVDLLNARYAAEEFDRIDFDEVRRLVSACVTGCDIDTPGEIPRSQPFEGFRSRLVACAEAASTGA